MPYIHRDSSRRQPGSGETHPPGKRLPGELERLRFSQRLGRPPAGGDHRCCVGATRGPDPGSTGGGGLLAHDGALQVRGPAPGAYAGQGGSDAALGGRGGQRRTLYFENHGARGAEPGRAKSGGAAYGKTPSRGSGSLPGRQDIQRRLRGIGHPAGVPQAIPARGPGATA